MNRPKQIQIPIVLFNQLLQYHLINENDELKKEIENGLNEKLNTIIKHELYTTYKTGFTEEEREKARLEYLDKSGISESFRY